MAKVYPTNKVWQSNPFANILPLFTNPAWTKHANAQASPDGKTLTLNATGPWQSTTYRFPLIPPTAYVLTGDIARVSGVGSPMVIIKASVGGVIRDVAVLYTTSVPVNIPAGAQWVDILPTASDSGTFTFSNLTLRRVQPVPIAANFKEFFKELVVNGDFSQGATGWGLLNGAVVSGGKVSYSPTASWTSASGQTFAVTPNTQYRLRADTNGAISANGGGGITYQVNGKIDVVITTGMQQLSMYFELHNGPYGAGTYTFDNLSLKRAMPT